MLTSLGAKPSQRLATPLANACVGRQYASVAAPPERTRSPAGRPVGVSGAPARGGVRPPAPAPCPGARACARADSTRSINPRRGSPPRPRARRDLPRRAGPPPARGRTRAHGRAAAATPGPRRPARYQSTQKWAAVFRAFSKSDTPRDRARRCHFTELYRLHAFNDPVPRHELPRGRGALFCFINSLANILAAFDEVNSRAVICLARASQSNFTL